MLRISLSFFRCLFLLFFFFFNTTAPTEIYTLSLHDALPISPFRQRPFRLQRILEAADAHDRERSEEHTSELQSHSELVCRLLLEKKKNPPRHRWPLAWRVAWNTTRSSVPGARSAAAWSDWSA